MTDNTRQSAYKGQRCEQNRQSRRRSRSPGRSSSRSPSRSPSRSRFGRSNRRSPSSGRSRWSHSPTRRRSGSRSWSRSRTKTASPPRNWRERRHRSSHTGTPRSPRDQGPTTHTGSISEPRRSTREHGPLPPPLPPEQPSPATKVFIRRGSAAGSAQGPRSPSASSSLLIDPTAPTAAVPTHRAPLPWSSPLNQPQELAQNLKHSRSRYVPPQMPTLAPIPPQQSERLPRDTTGAGVQVPETRVPQPRGTSLFASGWGAGFGNWSQPPSLWVDGPQAGNRASQHRVGEHHPQSTGDWETTLKELAAQRQQTLILQQQQHLSTVHQPQQPLQQPQQPLQQPQQQQPQQPQQQPQQQPYHHHQPPQRLSWQHHQRLHQQYRSQGDVEVSLAGLQDTRPPRRPQGSVHSTLLRQTRQEAWPAEGGHGANAAQGQWIAWHTGGLQTAAEVHAPWINAAGRLGPEVAAAAAVIGSNRGAPGAEAVEAASGKSVKERQGDAVGCDMGSAWPAPEPGEEASRVPWEDGAAGRPASVGVKGKFGAGNRGGRKSASTPMRTPPGTSGCRQYRDEGYTATAGGDPVAVAAAGSTTPPADANLYYGLSPPPPSPLPPVRLFLDSSVAAIAAVHGGRQADVASRRGAAPPTTRHESLPGASWGSPVVSAAGAEAGTLANEPALAVGTIFPGACADVADDLDNSHLPTLSLLLDDLLQGTEPLPCPVQINAAVVEVRDSSAAGGSAQAGRAVLEVLEFPPGNRAEPHTTAVELQPSAEAAPSCLALAAGADAPHATATAVSHTAQDADGGVKRATEEGQAGAHSAGSACQDDARPELQAVAAVGGVLADVHPAGVTAAAAAIEPQYVPSGGEPVGEVEAEGGATPDGGEDEQAQKTVVVNAATTSSSDVGAHADAQSAMVTAKAWGGKHVAVAATVLTLAEAAHKTSSAAPAATGAGAQESPSANAPSGRDKMAAASDNACPAGDSIDPTRLALTPLEDGVSRGDQLSHTTTMISATQDAVPSDVHTGRGDGSPQGGHQAEVGASDRQEVELALPSIALGRGAASRGKGEGVLGASGDGAGSPLDRRTRHASEEGQEGRPPRTEPDKEPTGRLQESEPTRGSPVETPRGVQVGPHCPAPDGVPAAHPLSMLKGMALRNTARLSGPPLPGLTVAVAVVGSAAAHGGPGSRERLAVASFSQEDGRGQSEQDATGAARTAAAAAPNSSLRPRLQRSDPLLREMSDRGLADLVLRAQGTRTRRASASLSSIPPAPECRPRPGPETGTTPVSPRTGRGAGGRGSRGRKPQHEGAAVAAVDAGRRVARVRSPGPTLASACGGLLGPAGPPKPIVDASLPPALPLPLPSGAPDDAAVQGPSGRGDGRPPLPTSARPSSPHGTSAVAVECADGEAPVAEAGGCTKQPVNREAATSTLSYELVVAAEGAVNGKRRRLEEDLRLSDAPLQRRRVTEGVAAVTAGYFRRNMGGSVVGQGGPREKGRYSLRSGGEAGGTAVAGLGTNRKPGEPQREQPQTTATQDNHVGGTAAAVGTGVKAVAVATRASRDRVGPTAEAAAAAGAAAADGILLEAKKPPPATSRRKSEPVPRVPALLSELGGHVDGKDRAATDDEREVAVAKVIGGSGARDKRTSGDGERVPEAEEAPQVQQQQEADKTSKSAAKKRRTRSSDVGMIFGVDMKHLLLQSFNSGVKVGEKVRVKVELDGQLLPRQHNALRCQIYNRGASYLECKTLQAIATGKCFLKWRPGHGGIVLVLETPHATREAPDATQADADADAGVDDSLDPPGRTPPQQPKKQLPQPQPQNEKAKAKPGRRKEQEPQQKQRVRAERHQAKRPAEEQPGDDDDGGGEEVPVRPQEEQQAVAAGLVILPALASAANVDVLVAADGTPQCETGDRGVDDDGAAAAAAGAVTAQGTPVDCTHAATADTRSGGGINEAVAATAAAAAAATTASCGGVPTDDDAVAADDMQLLPEAQPQPQPPQHPGLPHYVAALMSAAALEAAAPNADDAANAATQGGDALHGYLGAGSSLSGGGGAMEPSSNAPSSTTPLGLAHVAAGWLGPAAAPTTAAVSSATATTATLPDAGPLSGQHHVVGLRQVSATAELPPPTGPSAGTLVPYALPPPPPPPAGPLILPPNPHGPAGEAVGAENLQRALGDLWALASQHPYPHLLNLYQVAHQAAYQTACTVVRNIHDAAAQFVDHMKAATATAATGATAPPSASMHYPAQPPGVPSAQAMPAPGPAPQLQPPPRPPLHMPAPSPLSPFRPPPGLHPPTVVRSAAPPHPAYPPSQATAAGTFLAPGSSSLLGPYLTAHSAGGGVPSLPRGHHPPTATSTAEAAAAAAVTVEVLALAAGGVGGRLPRGRGAITSAANGLPGLVMAAAVGEHMPGRTGPHNPPPPPLLVPAAELHAPGTSLPGQPRGEGALQHFTRQQHEHLQGPRQQLHGLDGASQAPVAAPPPRPSQPPSQQQRGQREEEKESEPGTRRRRSTQGDGQPVAPEGRSGRGSGKASSDGGGGAPVTALVDDPAAVTTHANGQPFKRLRRGSSGGGVQEAVAVGARGARHGAHGVDEVEAVTVGPAAAVTTGAVGSSPPAPPSLQQHHHQQVQRKIYTAYPHIDLFTADGKLWNPPRPSMHFAMRCGAPNSALRLFTQEALPYVRQLLLSTQPHHRLAAPSFRRPSTSAAAAATAAVGHNEDAHDNENEQEDEDEDEEEERQERLDALSVSPPCHLCGAPFLAWACEWCGDVGVCKQCYKAQYRQTYTYRELQHKCSRCRGLCSCGECDGGRGAHLATRLRLTPELQQDMSRHVLRYLMGTGRGVPGPAAHSLAGGKDGYHSQMATSAITMTTTTAAAGAAASDHGGPDRTTSMTAIDEAGAGGPDSGYPGAASNGGGGGHGIAPDVSGGGSCDAGEDMLGWCLAQMDAELAAAGAVDLGAVRWEDRKNQRALCDCCATSLSGLFRSCPDCGKDVCLMCCRSQRAAITNTNTANNGHAAGSGLLPPEAAHHSDPAPATLPCRFCPSTSTQLASYLDPAAYKVLKQIHAEHVQVAAAGGYRSPSYVDPSLLQASLLPPSPKRRGRPPRERPGPAGRNGMEGLYADPVVAAGIPRYRVDEPLPPGHVAAWGLYVLPQEDVLDAAEVPAAGPIHIFTPHNRDLQPGSPRFGAYVLLCQQRWSMSEPIIVRECKGAQPELWQPRVFSAAVQQGLKAMRESRNDGLLWRKLNIIDCANSFQELEMSDKTFFELYPQPYSAECQPRMLKLKDYPPVEQFWAALPEHYQDFVNSLPLPWMTRPVGAPLNLATSIPGNARPPDLGPKAYVAFGTPEECETGFERDSVTKLHLDMTDAVNTLNHAQDRSSGAAWDIWAPGKQTQELRSYLLRHQEEFHDHGAPVSGVIDPIIEQKFFLSRRHRDRLWEEHGVASYHFVQREWDAVLIPAGCPHQVRNLTSCIKTAVDFVSPEAVREIPPLIESLRRMPRDPSEPGYRPMDDTWQDRLQGALITLSAALENCRTLYPGSYCAQKHPPRPIDVLAGSLRGSSTAVATAGWDGVPAAAGGHGSGSSHPTAEGGGGSGGRGCGRGGAGVGVRTEEAEALPPSSKRHRHVEPLGGGAEVAESSRVLRGGGAGGKGKSVGGREGEGGGETRGGRTGLRRSGAARGDRGRAVRTRPQRRRTQRFEDEDWECDTEADDEEEEEEE